MIYHPVSVKIIDFNVATVLELLKRKPLMYDAVAINSAVSVDSVKLLAARELLGRRVPTRQLLHHVGFLLSGNIYKIYIFFFFIVFLKRLLSISALTD